MLRNSSQLHVCHMSHVTCKISHVTCHVSHVIINIILIFIYFKISFWADGWGLSAEGLLSTGLPRLVSKPCSILMGWTKNNLRSRGQLCSSRLLLIRSRLLLTWSCPLPIWSPLWQRNPPKHPVNVPRQPGNTRQRSGKHFLAARTPSNT